MSIGRSAIPLLLVTVLLALSIVLPVDGPVLGLYYGILKWLLAFVFIYLAASLLLKALLRAEAPKVPKPTLRMRRTDKGVYVNAEDVLAWLRYFATTTVTDEPKPPARVVKQTADAWRDIWLGASQSAYLNDAAGPDPSADPFRKREE